MIHQKPTGYVSRRAFAVAVALAGAARAQDRSWPNRPVKIIVPLPAATANDVATRALAQKLSERWQQPGGGREQARGEHGPRRMQEFPAAQTFGARMKRSSS